MFHSKLRRTVPLLLVLAQQSHWQSGVNQSRTVGDWWEGEKKIRMRIYTFNILLFVEWSLSYSTIYLQWFWNPVFLGSQWEQLGVHFRFEHVQLLGWRQWPWRPVCGPAALSLCWRDSSCPRHRLCELWLLPAGELLHTLLTFQHRLVRQTPSCIKRDLPCLGHTLGFSLCWPFAPGQWDLTRFRSVISTRPWSSGVTRPPGAVPPPTSLWLSR